MADWGVLGVYFGRALKGLKAQGSRLKAQGSRLGEFTTQNSYTYTTHHSAVLSLCLWTVLSSRRSMGLDPPLET
jgi:hypothetical protein